MGDVKTTSATIQLKDHGGGVWGSSPTPSGQITITGVGFGGAPNIVLFDRMEGGVVGEMVALDSPEIGAWSTVTEGTENGRPRYKELDGITGFAMRDDTINPTANAKYTAQCIIDGLPEFSEYRLSYRVGMPRQDSGLGGYYPGGAALEPSSMDSAGSNWKMAWMLNSDYTNRGLSGSEGCPNVCVPTMVGADTFAQGNNQQPKTSGGSSIYFGGAWTVFGEWATLSYYQKADEVDPINGTNAVLSRGVNSTGQISNATWTGCTAYNDLSGNLINPNYRSLAIPGWFGNNGATQPYSSVQALYSGIYLATGPNSRARVVLANAATLSTASKVSDVAADSWTDTEVRITPTAWERLNCTHWIVLNADGTEQSGVLS